MRSGDPALGELAGVPLRRIRFCFDESCAEKAAEMTPCANSDKFRLSELADKWRLCANSDIDNLSELDHTEAERKPHVRSCKNPAAARQHRPQRPQEKGSHADRAR